MNYKKLAQIIQDRDNPKFPEWRKAGFPDKWSYIRADTRGMEPALLFVMFGVITLIGICEIFRNIYCSSPLK